MSKRLRIALLSLVVLATMCGFALTGCKTSSVLTELLVDQTLDNVDEQNEDTFINNVLTALVDTENLAQLEQSEEADLERERVEENPQEDSEESAESVPPTLYRDTADALASAESPSNEVGAEPDGSGASEGNLSSDGLADSTSQGTVYEGTGGTGTVYKGTGGTGSVYDATGTYADLPENVQTAVAFGEAANMVASFAGEHALVGADAEFLENDFIKRAYGDVIADAQTIAVDNVSGSIDVNAVVELEPDALILISGSCTLSESDQALLEENLIDVVYLPALTSASNITAAATYVGSMFGGSDNTFSGKDAQAAAQAYVTWHDELVDKLIKENGGLSSSINYDTGGTENVGSVSRWTLYIDQWDSATYYATPDNASAWIDAGGVAVSKVGYRWSPLSYYMSVGGSNNNAATFKSAFYDTSAYYYVWQFNLGRVTSTNDANWQGRTVAVSPLSNSGTSDLLVRSTDGSALLGSSAFPYVVVRTQAIKDALDSSRAKSEGLYAVYGTAMPTDGSQSGRGFLSGTGSLCESYISGEFSVEVNPAGLYSSWVEGSPESVLESAWIYDLNTGGSMLDDALRDYYELFYNYDLSDAEIMTIKAGLEA